MIHSTMIITHKEVRMSQRIILSLVHTRTFQNHAKSLLSKIAPKTNPKLSRVPRILLDVQNTLGNQILWLGAILNLMLQAIGTHVSLEFFGVSLQGWGRVGGGKDVP